MKFFVFLIGEIDDDNESYKKKYGKNDLSRREHIEYFRRI